METNILTYKNYQAVINFSANDKVFFGKIFGINDLVTFEAKSVKELEKAFKEAVEDYLVTCKELGKSPDKAYSGSFNIRIKPKSHQQLALYALKQGISLNEFVRRAIEKAVSNPSEAAA